jgi:hypothetical protein
MMSSTKQMPCLTFCDCLSLCLSCLCRWSIIMIQVRWGDRALLTLTTRPFQTWGKYPTPTSPFVLFVRPSEQSWTWLIMSQQLVTTFSHRITQCRELNLPLLIITCRKIVLISNSEIVNRVITLWKGKWKLFCMPNYRKGWSTRNTPHTPTFGRDSVRISTGTPTILN